MGLCWCLLCAVQDPLASRPHRERRLRTDTALSSGLRWRPDETISSEEESRSGRDGRGIKDTAGPSGQSQVCLTGKSRFPQGAGEGAAPGHRSPWEEPAGARPGPLPWRRRRGRRVGQAPVWGQVCLAREATCSHVPSQWTRLHGLCSPGARLPSGALDAAAEGSFRHKRCEFIFTVNDGQAHPPPDVPASGLPRRGHARAVSRARAAPPLGAVLLSLSLRGTLCLHRAEAWAWL